MSNVLVIGGAGFIGSHLVEKLQKGNKVVVVDDLSLGTKNNLKDCNKNVAFIKLDYTNKKKMEEIFKKVKFDYVYHFGGYSSGPMFDGNEAKGIQTNIVGFSQLLDLCVKYKVKRVMYASSSSIYGSIKKQEEEAKVYPPNFYSLTKYTMEHIARLYYDNYKLESVGFRFFSIYGKNEKHKGRYANLISQFLWAMEKGEPVVIYGDGEQTRDFTYVQDICTAIILGAHTGSVNAKANVYNIGTSETYTINEMIETLEIETGLIAKRKYVKNPIKNYVQHTKADVKKIRKQLGFKAEYSLKDGIIDIITEQ